MAKKTKKINPSIRIYRIIADAVLSGVECGWNRAHKHTETPDAETIKTCMYDEIMLSLDDVINFDKEA